jgi:hypothetical protein
MYVGEFIFVSYLNSRRRRRVQTRVSFETSFDSKQPKLEPKLVSALSETKRLFRLFHFHTETASFGVSIESKPKEDQPKQTETSIFSPKALFYYRKTYALICN